MGDRKSFDPSRIRPPPTDSGAEWIRRAHLTPRQVNELVSGAIARHLPPTLHVVGELADVSRPGSGHLYFTLKDAASELRCVMWRSAAVKLRFELRPGIEVIAIGGLEVYTPRGTYQLVVRSVEPRGAGALELAFRQLREKLEREGLFDPRRKRPLPRVPARIALITSPSGAAIHDVLRTLRRRFPALEVLLFPVRVQGEGAAGEIAAAIRLMNQQADALGGIDAAIVARGGGSLEDLWAFNEEVVARAVAASRVPIVSGVGHEVDVTIFDLVADVRAATPTAAAELVAPAAADLRAHVERQRQRVGRGAAHALDLARAALRAALSCEGLARPMARLRQRAQQIDEWLHRLGRAGAERFAALRVHLNRRELAVLRLGTAEQLARLARFDERLASRRARVDRALSNVIGAWRARLDARAAAAHACSPRRVLLRGYSVTRDARTRRVIRSIHDVREGARLITEVADGVFRSTAQDPRQPGLFDDRNA